MPESVSQLVDLTVDGRSFTGWTDVRVSLSLGQIAGTFELGITDRYPGEHADFKFRPGSECTVSLDGQTVITGYVEDFNPTYDNGTHTIRVSGRDKTCNLVDCSHLGPPVQWKGQALDKIAQEVCAPFGISVQVETGLGAAFLDVKYDEGDSCLSFLTKWARQRGVLLTSYGTGSLVITRSRSTSAGGSLVLGGNIKQASGNFSNKDRFSRYIVKGQSLGSFWKGNSAEEIAEFQAAYTGPYGEALDKVVGGYRPLVIISEVPGTSDQFADRARHEALVRAGKSRAASYTTDSWGPSAGSIWRINTLVQIKDDFMGLNESYLIEKCDYALSTSAGSTTTIGVVHPDAYNLRPEEPTDTASKISLRGMDQPGS